jgi:hypothetical protein
LDCLQAAAIASEPLDVLYPHLFQAAISGTVISLDVVEAFGASLKRTLGCPKDLMDFLLPASLLCFAVIQCSPSTLVPVKELSSAFDAWLTDARAAVQGWTGERGEAHEIVVALEGDPLVRGDARNSLLEKQKAQWSEVLTFLEDLKRENIAASRRR